MTQFPGGITNGARWYDVAGGMQDFNYVHSNCFEITLELGCCRHPAAADLKQEWADNKESLLRYIEATHMGMKGLVLGDAGVPLANAGIIVDGIQKESAIFGKFMHIQLYKIYHVAPQAPACHVSRHD